MPRVVNRSWGRVRPGGARYAVNLLGQAAGRGIYLAAGLATFMMVGRSAGPAVLGRYGLALAVLAVALVAADFGTTLTFGASLGACRPEARSGVLGDMLSARAILGTATGIALFCALPLLPAEIRPALALAGLLMPLAAARFLDPLFQVCGRPAWSALPSLASGAVLLGGTALALWWRAPEAALSLTAVGAGIVYGAVGLGLAARLVPLRPASLSSGSATLRAASGVGISNALGALNGRISLLMLAAFASAADLGQFTAGFRFFEFGTAVAVTLCAPMVPLFGRAAGRREAGRPPAALHEAGRTALTLVLAPAIAGTLAAWALAEPLVRLLFGADFAGAALVLRIAAVMSTAMLAATVLFAALVPLGRTGFAVRGSALACLANLAGCALLIPWGPVAGAALAALAAECAMLAVVAHAYRRAVGPPLGLSEVPAVLGPGLVTALAWAAAPAGAAPFVVPAVACLSAATGAWLRLRAPTLPLAVPDAQP